LRNKGIIRSIQVESAFISQWFQEWDSLAVTCSGKIPDKKGMTTMDDKTTDEDSGKR